MVSAVLCVLLSRMCDSAADGHDADGHDADGHDAGGHDRGATAVEYALMVAFIAVAIVASVAGFGGALSAKFGSFVGAL